MEPSQPAWVRGPMIGTLPSCQSFSKNVQVFDHAAIAASAPQRRQRRPRARRRPGAQVEPVRGEQRQREAVDAERDAAGVGDLARRGRELPGLAEMVLMVVEAHAGGRLLRRAHRDQQLELERLLDLVDRHQLAGAAEERIARRLGLVGAGRAGRRSRARASSTRRGTRSPGRACRCGRTRACGTTAGGRSAATARGGSSRSRRRTRGRRRARGRAPRPADRADSRRPA